MSEAKSLVVWKTWTQIHGEGVQAVLRILDRHPGMYEYAHDLTGRFLGVFREVRA